MYKLTYTLEAQTRIQAYAIKIRRQLKKAIERLAQNPNLGKRLTQELSDYGSYRTGDYRIIYQVFEQELRILIVTVGDRKEVYKKLSRRLS